MSYKLTILLKKILKSKKLSFSLILAILAFVFSFNQGFNFNHLSEFLPDELSFKKELQGKVLRVMDGDTLELIAEGKKAKIRLFGIDAPEKSQEFGKEARAYLTSLVLNQEVRVSIENKDKYQRIVGTIYLKEKDINEDLVKNGYAWAYRQYSSKYIAEEEDAKMFKLGLWKNPNAINPAEFRKRNR